MRGPGIRVKFERPALPIFHLRPDVSWGMVDCRVNHSFCTQHPTPTPQPFHCIRSNFALNTFYPYFQYMSFGWAHKADPSVCDVTSTIFDSGMSLRLNLRPLRVRLNTELWKNRDNFFFLILEVKDDI